MEFDKTAWERCAAFHGHTCAGLAIGYQAARCAAQLLGLAFSEDEEVVCVSENDACGVDAVQVLLGCSAGKGNLLFRIRGKQAFSFYDRKTGGSVRLVLKPAPEDIPREKTMDYYLSQEPKELFDVKPARPLPQPAKIFRSYRCGRCGETAAENWIRLVDGEYRCLDCVETYDRFNV